MNPYGQAAGSGFAKRLESSERLRTGDIERIKPSTVKLNRLERMNSQSTRDMNGDPDVKPEKCNLTSNQASRTIDYQQKDAAQQKGSEPIADEAKKATAPSRNKISHSVSMQHTLNGNQEL